MAGKYFKVISLPFKKGYFNLALQKSEDLQIALLYFPGGYSIHFPGYQLLQAKLSFREKLMLSEVSLNAITVFTDGSGKTHKSVITWPDQTSKTWESDIQTAEGSPQIVKIEAVANTRNLWLILSDVWFAFRQGCEEHLDLAILVGLF